MASQIARPHNYIVGDTITIHSPTGNTRCLPKPRTLADLIAGLHLIFQDDDIDIEEVKRYLGSYTAKDDEWKNLVKFDAHRYTRNLIDEGNGKFNLILLCWGGGQRSCIHDHSNSHCFMKVMKGGLTETKFEWPEDENSPMVNVGIEKVEKDEVVYINDSIGLHRVGNTSKTETACSLHLYSPPFQDCQTFDQNSGHKVRCHVTFHTKFGNKICYGNANMCAEN
uniref:Cysteine dioxygenase n=1 Tax=Ciona savignyi TaxID=51511 RepID=H2YAV7_CIOSA